MARAVVVLPASTGNVTVTTTETNLLASASAITAGALTNGVPLTNVDAYAIQVVNTGATDITLRLYLGVTPNDGLRIQSGVTTTVAAGATWSYQASGNAMGVLAITGQTGASTTTVRASIRCVEYP